MEDGNSMEDRDDVIDQLWYTRSIGQPTYGPRASSPGLIPDSERWRALESILNYSLPRGTVNRYAVVASQAPVCLALTTSAQGERILAHKVYTGSDHRATPFIQLLLGLPDEMTCLDAIRLWRSTFWQTKDVPQQGTYLPTISLDRLRQRQSHSWQQGLERDRLHQYLPFLIQAYLIHKAGQKIFIAAPPDDVAYLILALCRSLPAPLLSSFSFSTYESNISYSARYQLIGTCLPSPESGHTSEDPLPDTCYSEHLALNCYTGRTSSLPPHASDAADYAAFAADCFAGQDTEELDELFFEAERAPHLDIPAFLLLYEQTIGKVLLKDDVVALFKTPERVVQMLHKKSVRRRILDLLKEQPSLLTSIQPLIEQLHASATSTSPLPRVLNDFALVISQKARQVARNEEAPDYFISLLRLLNVVASADMANTFWHGILQDCQKDPHALAFLCQHWTARKELLINAVALVPQPDGSALRALLAISWSELGPLLELSLPTTWNALAVVSLLGKAPPTTAVMRHLERRNAGHLSALLLQLARSHQY